VTKGVQHAQEKAIRFGEAIEPIRNDSRDEEVKVLCE
jgi:hypothetical protein